MRLAVLSALACLSLAACGGGDDRFDAQGFVDAANEEGAELALGDPLPNSAEGVEVSAIELHSDEAGRSGGAEEVEHTHGGGSLILAEDEEAGIEEYERCESAVTLLCYRASNAVLILESEVPPDEQARIATAISGLAED